MTNPTPEERARMLVDHAEVLNRMAFMDAVVVEIRAAIEAAEAPLRERIAELEKDKDRANQRLDWLASSIREAINAAREEGK